MSAPTTSDPPPPLLAARGLGCTFGARALWHDLTLTVHGRERWAIVGPSGSGKTVLLRTLAGLAPRQAGTLQLDGQDFDTARPPAWRARAMYLAQRPALPEGTVAAALAAPFRWRIHRGKTFRREDAERALADIGIGADFLAQDTDRLSGGEAQLVAVLRALLLGPTLLLLDEPTASLDPARTAHVETLIAHWLAQQPARACLWTSHDAAQLARVSDHRLTLEAAP
ncbi:MAG: ATP-binding cassette domain-containing protein [Rhodanobacter sp.]|nr:MAG: ATP-binding cassette domain-containing protein [Rhodanobacter sp.]TAM13943.1 MAG: ATP-binding cassette domain-containing protein [Rhodanobacter sp.]TAM37785.1 MAG: ATP-binding cassette domain-containing protein [Rhodanobacter sp.]